MRNRCKTLLRDHSVPEVTLKAYPKHTQSQPYLRPSPLKDLKDLPLFQWGSDICFHTMKIVLQGIVGESA